MNEYIENLIPLETVRKQVFPHLSKAMFERKLGSKDIKLPVIRSDSSAKATKFIHLHDLESYLVIRRQVAAHEAK